MVGAVQYARYLSGVLQQFHAEGLSACCELEGSTLSVNQAFACSFDCSGPMPSSYEQAMVNRAPEVVQRT